LCNDFTLNIVVVKRIQLAHVIDFVIAVVVWIDGNWEIVMETGKPEHLGYVTRM